MDFSRCVLQRSSEKPMKRLLGVLPEHLRRKHADFLRHKRRVERFVKYGAPFIKRLKAAEPGKEEGVDRFIDICISDYQLTLAEAGAAFLCKVRLAFGADINADEDLEVEGGQVFAIRTEEEEVRALRA